MREFVSLGVSSFIGVGGMHYYGRLEVHAKEERQVDPDGTERWITRGGFGATRHPNDGAEPKRILGAREAAKLNAKDQQGILFRPSRSLRKGDATIRFNDVESLEAAAIALFATLFDETDVLVVETEQYSDVWRPLAGPAEVVAALDADRTWGQGRTLREMGYLRKDE